MLKEYGIERFGKLRSVLIHRPDNSIKKVSDENREFFLFDKVPDVDRYLEEHQRYGELLKSLGVQVHQLRDHVRRNLDLLDRLPNLAYMHDIAVVSSHGAILSKMSTRGRCHEEVVVKEALEDLNIPILYEPSEGAAFEGCLLLNPKTVFVANTQRHSRNAIEHFIRFILRYFDQVIYAEIPQARRFMHPDMVLNRMTDHLLIYYPPAFLDTYLFTRDACGPIDLKKWMEKQQVDLFPMSDGEQKRWGSSFVPLEPGVIINYDLSLKEKTVALLEREGIKFIHFHPDALLAGGGSLRCLTMRLWRN